MSELPTSLGVLNLHPIQVINSSSTLISDYENPKPLGLMDKVSVWDYFFKTLVRKTYKTKSLSIENRPDFLGDRVPKSYCEVRCSIKISRISDSEELQNLLTDLGEIGFDKPERVISLYINIFLPIDIHNMPGEEYFIDLSYSEKNSSTFIKKLTVPLKRSEMLRPSADYYEDASKEALLVLEEELTGIIETL
jgi:hypothetical protein